MRIEKYSNYLTGCRFCPMCKPFGEVSSLTNDEPHSTRIRGMLLWQITNGFVQWNREISQLLFECTLDSVSQEWCVNHYPVPEYILAARADIVEAGFAPTSVNDYAIKPNKEFANNLQSFMGKDSSIVFYPGDALAVNAPASTEAALKLLTGANQDVPLPNELHDIGALAYCLGRHELARAQINRVAELLQDATKIIVDGPLTLWFFTKIFPEFGKRFHEAVRIELLTDYLADLIENKIIRLKKNNVKINSLGSEFSRLTDLEYQPFRKLLNSVEGMEWAEPYDGLELANSSGAGGGLHLTSPEFARQISQLRVDEAKQSGAECLVSDLPLDSEHMKTVITDDFLVGTLPEILIKYYLG